MKKMINIIEPYEKSIDTIKYGAPLLSSSKDYDNVVSCYGRAFLFARKDTLILIGHGTEHFADASYAALNYHFAANGYDNVLVGTVEGYPDIKTIFKN